MPVVPPPVRTIPLVELRAPHPQGTIVVSCPDRLVKLGQWVLGSLAKQARLHDGMCFWLGSAPAVMKPRDGEWWACEPDLEKPGAVRKWDLFDAMILRALSEQVHEAAGIPVTKVPMTDMVLEHRDSIRDELVFLRHDPPLGPRDTGWYLQTLADVDDREPSYRDDLFPRSVYQLYVQRPALLSVMALPVGWIALFERHALERVMDPDDRVVWQKPSAPG